MNPIVVRVVLTYVVVCAMQMAIADDPKREGGVRTAVDATEAGHILEMISIEISGNHELLRSFDGLYDFQECFWFPGDIPRDEDGHAASIEDLGVDLLLNLGAGKYEGEACYWEISRGTAHVRIDVSTESLHTVYEPNKNVTFLDSKGEVHQWSRPGAVRHWIFTPEHSLAFQPTIERGQIRGKPPIVWMGDDGGRVAYRRSAAEGKGFNRVFDPRDFSANRSMRYDEICTRYADALLGKGSVSEKRTAAENCTVVNIGSSQGPVYEMTIVYPHASMKTVTTFDSSVGFNAVEYRKHIDEKRVEMRKMSYGTHGNNGFVVKDFTWAKYRPNTDVANALEIARIATLRQPESRFNVDIDESAFSVGSLGVTYGDRVLDEIEDRLMIYDDEDGLIPAEEFVLDRSRLPSDHIMRRPNMLAAQDKSPSERAGWNHLLLTVNIVIGVCVIVAIVIRRRRSQRLEKNAERI